ncbi:hypothetical protein V502_07756 [Pseudogymnoascus sp. VKM F-4520 (FW-2644)]|nr:hypothetical protein V502_07756 [Pseudogymnoascus sp. VKM F-4520 (FW-2644)]
MPKSQHVSVVPPCRAMSLTGSYDPAKKCLTIDTVARVATKMYSTARISVRFPLAKRTGVDRQGRLATASSAAMERTVGRPFTGPEEMAYFEHGK